MARKRRAHHELVLAQYVPRHERKGWMTRDFNIGGIWFLWRKNITTERGVYRFGVRGEPENMEIS